MCCHEQPPQIRPASASGPKWRQAGATRCGDARSTSMSVADLAPARTALRRTRTRSPGMVKGIVHGVRPIWATPSPLSVMDSISTSARSVNDVLRARRLSDVQQFDLEEKRGVRRDHAACALAAVAHLRRDRQRAFAADFHSGDSLIPALDDLPGTKSKRERLVAIARAVEFLSLVIAARLVIQPSGVVHRDLTSRDRLVTAAGSIVLFDKLCDVGLTHAR